MALPSLSEIGIEEVKKVKTFDKHIYHENPLEDYFEICESDDITGEYYNHWITTGWVGELHLDLILSHAIESGASDIHITAGQTVSFTILGDIVKQEQYKVPNSEVMDDLVDGILSNQANGMYVKDLEWDTSYQIRFGPYKDRRFRVSVGKSFESNFLVFRTIPDKIPTMEELGIEKEIIDWFDNSSGSVLVCGSTGSGKSLHKDTLIVTENGLKKVSEVSKGDYLFDKDGNKTKVLDLHYADKEDVFYLLTFDNGERVRATGRHLWLILDNKNIWRTVDTDFIYNNPKFTYRIPRTPRIDFYNGATYNERKQLVNDYLSKSKRYEDKFIYEGTDSDKLAELSSSLSYLVNRLNDSKVIIEKYKKVVSSKIVYIEKIEDDYKDYICFEVDSPSHSYLFSEMFLATHNSTTMSSILRDIQLNQPKKIITIEKPVEAVYPQDGKGMVVQRAIPEDCLSFDNGLTSALRQNPDFILIGEVRNQIEVNEFLRAAETGHLAMSTIHTVNNVTTLNRIRSLFTGDEQRRILATLGDVLRGIVNQVLVKSIDGNSRFAVREILTIDYKIRKLIAEDRFSEIRAYQEENEMTMEHKLIEVYLQGKCSLKEARSKAPDQIYFDEILSKKNA